MDLKQTTYFLALAETLSFTRAAAKCGISQPALTQAIRRLERELGGRLIHRDGRRTRLTPFGHAVLERVKALEAAHRAVLDTAESERQRALTRLDLGVMCTIGGRRIAPMLAGYCAAHEGTELVLHDIARDDAARFLRDGTLELAIVTDRVAGDDRLEFLPLYKDALVLACHAEHPLAALPRVTSRDIAAHIYFDRLKCEFRDELMDAMDEEGLSLRVCASSEREDWIQSLVATGAGVSTIPEDGVLLSELRRVPLEDDVGLRTVGLVRLRGAALSPAAADLHAFAGSHPWE